jgi:hypothetical protein
VGNDKGCRRGLLSAAAPQLSSHRFLLLDGFRFQFVQSAETAGGKTGLHAEVVGGIVDADEQQRRFQHAAELG